METNKEEILYEFLTGLFRLVRWFRGKREFPTTPEQMFYYSNQFEHVLALHPVRINEDFLL